VPIPCNPLFDLPRDCPKLHAAFTATFNSMYALGEKPPDHTLGTIESRRLFFSAGHSVFIQETIRGYFAQPCARTRSLHSNNYSKSIQVHVTKNQTGLRLWERLGLSDCDFCEFLRPPELFHPLIFGDLGIMGEDGGVLGAFGGSECCVRAT